MDSSDITRRRKQRVQFADRQPVFIAKNPAGDCSNLTACCTPTTNCNRNFVSYDQKYTFYKGRNACQAGAVAQGDFGWGVTGCMIPETGGSK
jgi:hypothetical protein